jgi:hypothetical protein
MMEILKHGKVKIVRPLSLWKFFERNHSGRDRTLEIDEYEIFYQSDTRSLKENDLLCQIDRDGLEKSIKFKTFKRYFYQILREDPRLKGH